MADMLIAPENETFPNRRRWTVEQCYRLAETGELSGRWELIDGEVLSKMGQKPPHIYTLMMVMDWLVSVFGANRTRIQLPITISGEIGNINEPEPDITVVADDPLAFTDTLPGGNDVVVIVEIADSSVPFDLGPKALLYSRAGVKEYWVVDINGRRIFRHRSSSEGGYLEIVELGEADLISPAVRPDSSIQISRLLPLTSAE